MAKWKCSKCGETALSKCVNQRNVFPDDQMATLFDYWATVEVIPREVHKADGSETLQRSSVVITLKEHTAAPDLTDVFSRLLGFIVNDATVRHMLCTHAWKIESGPAECDLGCKHD